MKFPVLAADGAGDGAGAGAGAGAAAGAAAGAGAGADGKGAGAATGAAGAGAAGAGAGAAAGGDGKGAGVTAGEGGGEKFAQVAINPYDADHFRSSLAGDDPKKKAFLDRHTDIKSVAESAYLADKKISELSAIAKKVLPDNATPEQITEYRKNNGIPEKPEEYFTSMPKAVVEGLDDDSKAMLTPYMGLVRDLNLPPDAAAKVVQVWQAEQDRQVVARTEADNVLRVKTEDALRGEWGNNYRAEINNIHNLLSGFPPEVSEAIQQARTPDGNALVGTPQMIRALAQMARMISPYSVPVGNDGGSLDQKGVEARITEIESWMGSPNGSENYKKYFGSEKVQTEYRNLVDAREMLKKRTAA